MAASRGRGLPRCFSVKHPPATAGDTGDMGLIPGSGRSPEGGHGNPLQYSCLENPMDRGAWQVIVHGVRRSQTRLKWLSTHAHTQIIKNTKHRCKRQKYNMSTKKDFPDHRGPYKTREDSAVDGRTKRVSSHKTPRRGSAPGADHLTTQPAACCLWLYHWNESHGNILASGRTGEMRETMLTPSTSARPCVHALVSAENLLSMTAAHTWILKTKAKGFHWAFQNRPLFAFMSYKKVPFSKISLAEDQAIVYGCEKTFWPRSQNPRY